MVTKNNIRIVYSFIIFAFSYCSYSFHLPSDLLEDLGEPNFLQKEKVFLHAKDITTNNWYCKIFDKEKDPILTISKVFEIKDEKKFIDRYANLMNKKPDHLLFKYIIIHDTLIKKTSFILELNALNADKNNSHIIYYKKLDELIYQVFYNEIEQECNEIINVMLYKNLIPFNPKDEKYTFIQC